MNELKKSLHVGHFNTTEGMIDFRVGLSMEG